MLKPRRMLPCYKDAAIIKLIHLHPAQPIRVRTLSAFLSRHFRLLFLLSMYKDSVIRADVFMLGSGSGIAKKSREQEGSYTREVINLRSFLRVALSKFCSYGAIRYDFNTENLDGFN